MNWIRFSLILSVIGLTIALTTACGASEAVPATPTAIPKPVVQTPVVQVAPSSTPIPPTLAATPTRTAAPTQAATITRTPIFTPTASPKDMLMAAFVKALAGLKTYRVVVPQESRYIAVQLPDRFLQEEDAFFLKIGATVWTSSPMTGQLQRGTGNLPFFDRANLYWYRDQFSQSTQIVLLGPGMAESVPCIGYSANFTLTKIMPPKTPGAAPETTQVPQSVKIWFATTDGFPRRVEMGPPVSLTINFFDLNSDFSITPPQ